MGVVKGLTIEQLDNIVFKMKEKCTQSDIRINELSIKGQSNSCMAGMYIGEIEGITFCMKLINEELNDETRIDLQTRRRNRFKPRTHFTRWLGEERSCCL